MSVAEPPSPAVEALAEVEQEQVAAEKAEQAATAAKRVEEAAAVAAARRVLEEAIRMAEDEEVAAANKRAAEMAADAAAAAAWEAPSMKLAAVEEAAADAAAAAAREVPSTVPMPRLRLGELTTAEQQPSSLMPSGASTPFSLATSDDSTTQLVLSSALNELTDSQHRQATVATSVGSTPHTTREISRLVLAMASAEVGANSSDNVSSAPSTARGLAAFVLERAMNELDS